jgi:hypothetical protein
LGNNRNVADAYNYARKNGKNKKHSFHFSPAPSDEFIQGIIFYDSFLVFVSRRQNKNQLKSSSKDK